ncbi:zinc finger domain-containing protein [Streptomyces bacillaris]|uniref:zinc finger domain-containing protein n=1 Tax=Streptomyces bacillaris TaxID=68179 RepID=UPI004064585D
MPRREPTIHNPALTVTCPHCRCVPGAPCLDSRGSRLTGGRVHRRRTAEYVRRGAATTTR